MLRNRDIVAVLMAVLLARFTWQDLPGSTLWVSVHLSFFVPLHRDHHRNVTSGTDGGKIKMHSLESKLLSTESAVMDLDGDGRAEAMVVLDYQSDAAEDEEATFDEDRFGSYAWQILDLKPAVRAVSAAAAGRPGPAVTSSPFRPGVLLQSERMFWGGKNSTVRRIRRHGVEPLAMTTGQVELLVRGRNNNGAAAAAAEKRDGKDSVNITDRTRHFFCGRDWHDAANSCRRPCPSGEISDCDDGDKCFADTPCDYWQYRAEEEESASRTKNHERLHTTLAGGWPSIWTFWSHGVITMHSLTGDKPPEEEGEKNENGTATAATGGVFSGLSAGKKKGGRLGSGKGQLQLRAMWETSPFVNRSGSLWEDARLMHVDALSTGMNHGIVLVSANVDWEMPRKNKKNADGQEGLEEDDELSEEDAWTSSFVLALHDQTGELLWQSFDEVEDEFDNLPVKTTGKHVELPDPTFRGSRSFARRRSYNPNLHPAAGDGTTVPDGSMVPNCVHAYGHSLLSSEALPTFYEGEEDATLRIIHLDHPTVKKKRHGAGDHSKNHKSAAAAAAAAAKRKLAPGAAAAGGDGTGGKKTSSSSKAAETRRQATTSARTSSRGRQVWGPMLTWFSSSHSSDRASNGGHHHHRRRQRRRRRRHHGKKHQVLYGRPNALSTHHFEGIQLRSLKNGRPLCHLSLWGNTMYADLNGDGTLDAVQVITGTKNVRDEDDTDDADHWMYKLVERVSHLSKNESRKEMTRASQYGQAQHMCHVQALSGLPAKEELFSGSLCGPRDDRDIAASAKVEGISGAPPLAVENGGYNQGWDIIVAVGHGLVHRFRGSTGRRVWHLSKEHAHDFPRWEGSSKENVLLATIEVDDHYEDSRIPFHKRPVVLTGDKSVAVLAPGTGRVLATASFPQAVQYRPVLADWNGDGTDDLLIVTKDAIWGYHISVRSRPSVFATILTGLLFFAVLLAILRNRFGPHPGKRSTDA